MKTNDLISEVNRLFLGGKINNCSVRKFGGKTIISFSTDDGSLTAPIPKLDKAVSWIVRQPHESYTLTRSYFFDKYQGSNGSASFHTKVIKYLARNNIIIKDAGRWRWNSNNL